MRHDIDRWREHRAVEPGRGLDIDGSVLAPSGAPMSIDPIVLMVLIAVVVAALSARTALLSLRETHRISEVDPRR